MFNNIFAYIDRIMNLVRPRKILFMAIGKDNDFFEMI